MYKICGYLLDEEDASLVFYSVLLGYLKPVQRRLTQHEKLKISSGDIFCFIETPEGMKRWTDGKSWSPSKILGDFLLYTEVPKYFSKSSIQKRKKSFGYIENKAGMAIMENSTALCKKTINFIRGDNIYHIIAYYRPCMSKNSLQSLPFFYHLKKAVEANPNIITDKFISKLPTDRIERENYLWNHCKILTTKMCDDRIHQIQKKYESYALDGLNKLFGDKKN